MSTRIVCISDCHNRQGTGRGFGQWPYHMQSCPESDILVVAGDITMSGTTPELENFLSWAKNQRFKHKVLIAGNHDFCFESRPADPKRTRELAIDLCGIAGVTYLEDTDVLITHGPPAGIRDVTTSGESVGCQDLRSRIDSMNGLKLHVFGHIHEGAGKSVMGRGVVGQGISSQTIFVNASVVNRRYECVNQPIELDLG